MSILSIFKQKQKETYLKQLVCINCERAFEFNIEKGMAVEEFLRRKFCPYCGCRTLRKNRYEANTYY